MKVVRNEILIALITSDYSYDSQYQATAQTMKRQEKCENLVKWKGIR
jgi:hypothetical protein